MSIPQNIFTHSHCWTSQPARANQKFFPQAGQHQALLFSFSHWGSNRDIFVKNWELGAESLSLPGRSQITQSHTETGLRFGISLFSILEMTRKDLSKCKLWWGESRKWASVCGLAGWQLDESIPTNCFNYFSPSQPSNLFSLLPNLPTFFTIHLFACRVSLHLVPAPTVARFLFVVCKDRSSWLFTNSSGI